MPRIYRRPQAEADLDEIWWYIAQDSPRNADKFLDLIQEKSLLLSSFPGMGEHRDELIEDLRSFPVGNYLIFYFMLDDGIDILRVIHGSRNLGILFN